MHTFKPARPELNYDPQQPDRIFVDCTDGRRKLDIPYPLGSPQEPISQQQLEQKFSLNTGLDEAKSTALWQRLKGWQESANIHHLFTAFPDAGN